MSDIEVEDFLEHFGVRGMKWGQRKAAFQKNRELNKASKAKDKIQRKKEAEKFEKQVEAARVRMYSGQTDRKFKEAKAQYKKDKVDLGSREAKKILREKQSKLYKDLDLAGSPKNNQEYTLAILKVVGNELSRASTRSVSMA